MFSGLKIKQEILLCKFLSEFDVLFLQSNLLGNRFVFTFFASLSLLKQYLIQFHARSRGMANDLGCYGLRSFLLESFSAYYPEIADTLFLNGSDWLIF